MPFLYGFTNYEQQNNAWQPVNKFIFHIDYRYNLWMRLKVNIMQRTHESEAKFTYNACFRSPISVVEMSENKAVKISSVVFI